ncbi:MAG: hypothetical protein CL569_06225 [Alphaproteobacteria bacterium]|nr:hypothetical protein [Alphaproteobacteria bacterium]|tara:strand:- start:13 stop:291 length:279 start_codon:yes stop_codon:yes gene_type:complete
MLTEVKRWLVHVLELLLWIVAVLTLLQVLFGSGVPEFFGIDVIGNIGDLVQKFGNAGLVGVVAAVIVSYLILRERNGSSSQGQSGGPPSGGY